MGTVKADEEAAELVFQAVLYGNDDLLQELLLEDTKASCVKDSDGRVPLHHAAILGYSRCATILLQSGCKNFIDVFHSKT